jgi:hypothetical protein
MEWPMLPTPAHQPNQTFGFFVRYWDGFEFPFAAEVAAIMLWGATVHCFLNDAVYLLSLLTTLGGRYCDSV